MRELNLEIPLLGIPLQDRITTRFLEDLLRCVELTYLLRIRGEGFLMICRVAPNAELPGNPLMAESFSDRIHIKVLNMDKTGAKVLQISGTWIQLFNITKGKESKVVRFMKSIRRKPIYITQNPSFQGGMLRISVLGEDRTIADLLEELNSLDVPFKVARLGSTKSHKESPLADLTERQASILRLAYSLGYYEIPKKTRVEDIARLLGIDKGTAGEHLQRAEKHVFDRLLQLPR